MKTAIGIDPGKSGGWVFRDEMGVITSGKLDCMSDFIQFMDEAKPEVAYIEKLTGYNKKYPMPAAKVFVMAETYWGPLYYLLALGTRVELVTPQQWQKVCKVGSRKHNWNTTKWKNHLKDLAKRLYPSEKVAGWNADAFLILEYGLKQSN